MPQSQDGDHTSPDTATLSPRPPTSPIQTFAIPKNRSTGNFLSQVPPSTGAPPPQRGVSFDSGVQRDVGSQGSASPVAVDHEHAINPSGLQRIRQQPKARLTLPANQPPDPQNQLAPMTIPMPTGAPYSLHATGPVSPLLSVGEDLSRFPSESLHSFSFAHQSGDYLRSRQNVLKRSMDFIKDRIGWAAGGVGVAHAHAKVSGDQEAQSMMDLLNRANLLGPGASTQRPVSSGFSIGPITGPAELSADNVFEKSFLAQGETQSPTTMHPPSGAFERIEEEAVVDEEDECKTNTAESEQSIDFTPSPLSHAPTIDVSAPSFGSAESNSRSTLKRTYTDIAHISLQSRLSDVLAQPYIINDSNFLSPTGGPFSGGPAGVGSAFPSFAGHAHGRGAPQTQAIFTTNAQEPWIITAANDLACLTFGVTKAELRRIGIMELLREDKRSWLEGRLRGSQEPLARPRRPPDRKVSPSMGNGVTAKLLSKPPSRETGQGRRSKSADGRRGNNEKSKSPVKGAANGSLSKSRGVLLCGDVLPILKRNGADGSATFWVQEKRGCLIWVMEEIAEDVAFLSVDEVGCVTKASGKVEAVWGMERVRNGMDITRLLPGIPRLKGTHTGALDYDQIEDLRRFTARTANDISIPVTIDRLSGEQTFRVSSFPHIAGMMVMSASTLKVTSANTVVCESLFGRVPNGLPMTDVIPGFDKMLNVLVEEDNLQLVEGMVIPEHSFRRARAMLALREGMAEAAAVFLRPSGVPALHRDGAEIMIDVQMRVVKSETFSQTSDDDVIEERREEEEARHLFTSPQVVYALWVTYSRTLHAVNHGVGPISPVISRPGTPPTQPSPGPAVPSMSDESEGEETKGRSGSGSPSRDQAASSASKARIATAGSIPQTPLPATATTRAAKKTIDDFTILEDMGTGAYGQVKLARSKQPPYSKVVIKYVTKRKILVDTWTRDRRLGTVPLEIHVLDYLRRIDSQHPNIVEMSDFFEDDINYYIEMVPHGLPGMDLFDYIELRVNMAEEECREIFAQVASAIEFLHIKAKVVHRDIKDENVILDGEGKIKLIDFGSASYIKNGPFDVFVGTIDYAAPEVLQGSRYAGPAQDIWALGILLYTILYKENPFYSIDEIMDHDLRVPYVVSEASIALVRKMLDRNVDARVDIQEIVADPWTRGLSMGENAGVAPTGS